MKNSKSDNIHARVQFDVDDQTRHSVYLLPAPYIGFNHRIGTKAMEKITVKDGRNNNDLTFDKAAFELVECPTVLATEDFYEIQKGNEELKTKYYEEVANYVKEKLGCDRVICMNSQVRNQSKSNGSVFGDGIGRYATVPHTDTSPVSSDVAALRLLEYAKDTTTYKRYCLMNLWRNISDEPIQNYPLAMLDERSAVKPDDYIIKDFISKDTSVVQWALSPRHADQHKWYYFPGMTKSEAILFKQVDSDFTKTGRSCFHMAVLDSNAPWDAPPRESIEVRMLCYWKNTETGIDTMPTKEKIFVNFIQDPKERLLNQPIGTASVFTLIKTLFERIPIVGEILVVVLVQVCALYRPFTTSKINKVPQSGCSKGIWIDSSTDNRI